MHMPSMWTAQLRQEPVIHVVQAKASKQMVTMNNCWTSCKSQLGQSFVQADPCKDPQPLSATTDSDASTGLRMLWHSLKRGSVTTRDVCMLGTEVGAQCCFLNKPDLPSSSAAAPACLGVLIYSLEVSLHSTAQAVHAMWNCCDKRWAQYFAAATLEG